MKIPLNMTEQEVLEIIEKVGARLAPKFTFGYYDEDDIKQQIFFIACDGLERYDGVRPLENFLSVHCRNRIGNFKRNNYYRNVGAITEKQAEINEVRKNLMDAIDIDEISDDAFVDDFSVTDMIMSNELFETIDAMLPAELRHFYLRMSSNCQVPQHRKKQVEDCIREIIENENWTL